MADDLKTTAPATAGTTVFDDMPMEHDGRTAHAREMDERKFTINFGPQTPRRTACCVWCWSLTASW